jgi:hypothetical protein
MLALAAGVGTGVAVAGTDSTELGDTTSAPTYGVETPVVQFATTPGTKSYTTPHGVLTSWRYHSSADAAAGTVRLELFRPTGAPNTYEAVAASGTKTLAPNTPYEFFERIPVEPGYILGLDPGLDAEVAITVPLPSEDKIRQFSSELQVGESGVATTPSGTYRVNVAATVEPDADRDEYGDKTQDQCPSDASRQGPCLDTDPPETRITKHPANKSKKPTARFRFASDEPASTFECKLKGKDLKRRIKLFNECDSPRKYRRLDEGKYRFKVRATDQAGNVDLTPAKDRFRTLD